MAWTLKDKIDLLDGKDVWYTKAINGLPSVQMADGPHGLRKQLDNHDHLGKMGSVKATAFPTASLLACSFDCELVKKTAGLIAKEAKAEKVSMILGPGINMKRSPLCGRNFEYFSEDPRLAGELAAHYVEGAEDEGVGTSVKHFFANNQERYRFNVESIIDERTLREIYLKAFEIAVKKNPASIMTSYNKVNGYYASESPIIRQILRNEWGYQGLVVSDWGSISNRSKSIKAGCDLEMPSSMGYRSKHVLKDATHDQKLVDAIDASSKRIQAFAQKYQIKENTTVDLKKHHQEAITIAEESMVLLKNEDVLPLNENEHVLIVSGFKDEVRYQGGGSSHINPYQLDQIKDIYASYSKTSICIKGFSIQEDTEDQDLIHEATEAAKTHDKIIFIAGLPDYMETEGIDRSHIDLPHNQTSLIQKLHQINPNIILVVLTGSVVNLSIRDYVKAVLVAYLGGQGVVPAIFNTLYGKNNPSGRLAETWIDDLSQCNVTLTDDNHAVYYDETIYIGYRYYQTFNQPVSYPFGFGLSYSRFDYEDVEVSEHEAEINVSFKLTNHGPYDGKEVILVFVEHGTSNIPRAKRELVTFDKVYLKAHESIHHEITIPKDRLKVFDVESKTYVYESIEETICLCKNVTEIIAQKTFNIEGKELINRQLSYQKESYDTSDFKTLFNIDLPEKKVKKKRPYDLDTTVEDLRNTLVGRIVAHFIVKEGLKTIGDDDEVWLVEVAKKTMNETPLKMLALFSDGQVSFEFLEGLLEIINGHVFRGFKKIRIANKENKNESES